MSVTLLLLLVGAAIGGYLMYRKMKNRKRPVI